MRTLTSPLHYLFPKPFTLDEIQYHLNRFPRKNYPGLDLIRAEVARQFPKKAIMYLTQIPNSVLRLSYFSLQWKTSVKFKF